LACQDGKRPDGLTIIAFEGGRSLTCDATVTCSTADLAVQDPSSVADVQQTATSRKQAKYVDLQSQYNLQLIAIETLRPFLDDSGRRISLLTGEDRSFGEIYISHTYGYG